MALGPKSGDTALSAAIGVATLVALIAVLAVPEAASAALQGAAGGKPGGGGGFSRFVEFINRLADYTIPIGSAFSVLGLVWGGLLFQAGYQRAGRVLGFVAGSWRGPVVQADRGVTRVRWRRVIAAAVALVGVIGVSALVSPPAAQAAIHMPGVPVGIPNPFDLGLPSPTDLIGNVFEFFFKTFLGIEANVTQRTVTWLLAAPVYTDNGAYSDLNQLRASIAVAAWALFTLGFTVSAVRYYASGFTSAGSYEAVEALTRGGVAAGALALYPQAFGSLAIAANYLTYAITHDPSVGSGLTKLLERSAADDVGDRQPPHAVAGAMGVNPRAPLIFIESVAWDVNCSRLRLPEQSGLDPR